jgi:hypothetical protein
MPVNPPLRFLGLDGRRDVLPVEHRDQTPEAGNMRHVTFACIALMIASALPVDARSHRRAHPTKPAAQAT